MLLVIRWSHEWRELARILIGGKAYRWESGKVGTTLNPNLILNLGSFDRVVSRGSDNLVALVVRLGKEPRRR